MPELPEVETMRTQLEKFLVNHTIVDLIINDLKIISGETEKIVGGKVISVRRFGKVSSIDLDNGYSILTHVKLTGQFLYRGPRLLNPTLSKKVAGGIPGKHTHVIFKLDDGGVLYYNDFRRFGWIRVLKTKEVENEKFIKALGPEPHITTNSAGKILTYDYFSNLLRKSKRNIKVLLMDQTKIGGIGNIYANDALWLSRISPKRTSNTINDNESKLLFDSIQSVLEAGFKYGGASELSFVTPDGKEGEYQNHTLVFGHTGELCNNCKSTKIEKFFLGGRGTYWCTACQK